jgi:hypothetical protein
VKIISFSFAALLVIAGLSFSTPCLAEDPVVDVVVMKDGTVIKGTIVKLNTVEVVIETLEGETVTRAFQDVYTFQEEPLMPPGSDPAGAGPGEKPPSFFDRHLWEIGAEVYTVTYEEPGLMEQTGVMAGVAGSYAYHDGWMFKAELRLAQGQVDYTSRGTGSMSDIDDALLETRLLVGYDVVMSDISALTVYAGFGYRYLEDDSAGRTTTTGHWGYGRESNYFYSPIGIETVTLLSDKWQLSFVVEYDYFWKGRQESYLSDVAPGYSDLSNNQNSGYGIRAALGLEYNLAWGTLSFEPFIRYWDIGKSEESLLTTPGPTIYIGWEPANTTVEAGLTVSCRF